MRNEPPVWEDASKKRSNSGSATKNKTLGYEPHSKNSNSMVSIGTFFGIGVLMLKVENLTFSHFFETTV